eukprot:gnl/Spiro4/10259_TR5453_c0_g1_i5.p1 gnl/Spiro4/10259_TR5453_c0_g1~~gnl/Spiro4/10259_TR5453_c0_g1_i5.p1  ORF type:complete len:128 (+),score=8.73 gnl/Spiro4/10259_TR5453_c0_g1_i5:74-457(+)
MSGRYLIGVMGCAVAICATGWIHYYCAGQRKKKKKTEAAARAEQQRLFDATRTAAEHRPVIDSTSAATGSECPICCTRKIATMFKPCNHAYCCVDCAERILANPNPLLRKCPSCRATLTEVERIYMP